MQRVHAWAGRLLMSWLGACLMVDDVADRMFLMVLA